ncbi:hypothetical protein, partial [Microcoleus anatoxicus]|uniref:hypothetical protein n=1 Tax=Microcoleus anatoxicus TaxID=2705319 RepID=UPI0030C8D559
KVRSNLFICCPLKIPINTVADYLLQFNKVFVAHQYDLRLLRLKSPIFAAQIFYNRPYWQPTSSE